MNETLNKYGLIILMATIGASVNKVRKKMSWKRFLSSAFIAVFTAVLAGILIEHFFALPQNVINAICGFIGIFAEYILDEAEETIKKISDYISKKLE